MVAAQFCSIRGLFVALVLRVVDSSGTGRADGISSSRVTSIVEGIHRD